MSPDVLLPLVCGFFAGVLVTILTFIVGDL
jgi:hypothetical protein